MGEVAIGVVLSTIGEPGDGPAVLDDVAMRARQVEEYGLDAVWVPDVLTGDGRPALDCAIVLGAAAGATSRIQLGFGVFALPLRPVAGVAAQIQTLQHVSAGRLVFGTGIGGFPGSPFWRAVGAAATGRGHRFDAALAVLPRMVAGESVAVGDTEVTLAPAAAVPPILIAGRTERGLARAVRHGGWFGGGAGSGGPAEFARDAARIREIAAELGRPIPTMAVAPQVTFSRNPAARVAHEQWVRSLIEEGHLSSDEAGHLPLIDNPTRAAEHLDPYLTAGATHIVTGVEEPWPDKLEFLAEVKDLLR